MWVRIPEVATASAICTTVAREEPPGPTTLKASQSWSWLQTEAITPSRLHRVPTKVPVAGAQMARRWRADGATWASSATLRPSQPASNC